MKKHVALWVGLAVLFGVDHVLAGWAVELNAAGALLSPGGAVDLVSLFVAAMFLLNRLVLSFGFCALVAFSLSATVGAIFRFRASKRTPGSFAGRSGATL